MNNKSSNKVWMGENIIFLISQPRSGSTLLQRLLNGHPEVHSTAEPWIMLHPIYALKKNGIETEYDFSLARQGRENFLNQIPEGEELYIQALRNFGSVLYNKMISISGKKYFLDKTPRYYNIIPELYRVFSKAKFIILYRNPIAVMSSILKTWCENKPEVLKNSFNYNDLIKGPKFLTEGAKLLGSNGIIVHYENMVKHPNIVIQTICAKIGIPYNEKMLRYGQNQSPKGSFGDQTNINHHSKPVTDYVNKWAGNITEPVLIDFANEYLSLLGSNIVSEMGYSYQELKRNLNTPKILYNQVERQADKSFIPFSSCGKIISPVQVATSLAPRDIEIQKKAVNSWIELGFKVFSINSEEEIELLNKKFPQVNFVKAKRHGKNIFGKQYIYFDDFIYFFMNCDSNICGIINSDNILMGDTGIISFLRNNAEKSLVYGSRVEIKTVDSLEGAFYNRGFDFFFFDKSILSCFPESKACIGVTWWDYWAVVMPLLENVEVKKLISPFSYHITHPTRWDEDQWHFMGKHISEYLYNKWNESVSLKIENNSLKIFNKILSNATHYYLLNNEMESEEKLKISYGMLPQVALSILTFLDKMSLKIEYKDDKYRERILNNNRILFNENLIAFDLNEQGEKLLRKGNLKDALQKFIKCLEIDKKFYKAHFNLGLIYHKIGDLGPCLAHFKTALEIKPDDEAATIHCSKILIKLGKLYEARILYSYYLSQNPGNFKIGKLLSDIEKNNLSLVKSCPKISIMKHRNRDIQSIYSLCKNNMIKVSAIVSAFNSEKFIRECIEDLTAQTICDSIEIIIVDSGSQQNEKSIVKEYQKKFNNIKYIKTNKRETVYAAWNRGIKEATGKYITSANTDDRHRKDAFEIMTKALENNPDIALVYGDVLITEKENEKFDNCSPVGAFRWLEWKREDLLSKGCFMGPQPMWRKSLHDEYGYFDKTLVTSGDYEFWLRISQTHKFLHLPVLLGLYLKSPDSIEHRNRNRQSIENKRIKKIYKNALETGKIVRKRKIKKHLQKLVCGTSYEKKVKEQKTLDIYKKMLSELATCKTDVIINKITKFLIDFPDFALGHNDLGVHYHRQGNNKLALDQYQLAVEYEPGNTIFRKNLADHLVVTFGEYEKALQHYVTVLASDTGDLEALLATGIICARFELFDDAIEIFEKVIEIEPHNQDALNWLTEMRGKTKIESEKGSSVGYQALLAEIDQVDLTGALQKIEAFIKLHPNHGQALNDLGVIYYKTKSKGKALACYYRAVELEPNSIIFRKNLADFLYVEESRVQEALENYHKVLRVKPDDIETLLIIGHIYTATKCYENAVIFYQKVLAIEPRNIDALHNLQALDKRRNKIKKLEIMSFENTDKKAEIEQIISPSNDKELLAVNIAVEDLIKRADTLFQMERIDQAIDLMLKAISGNPQDGRTYLELTRQLINYGRYENAIEVLAEMPANQTEKYAKLKRLLEGYGQEKLGNFTAAKRCVDLVLDYDHENSKGQNLMGILAYRNGDKESAEKHFKHAIETDSNYGEPHSNLGVILLEKGRVQLALDYFERGFFISPTDIDIANAYHEAVTAAGEFARAEKVARKVLKHYPKCRKIRFLLIDTLIRQDKTGDALKEIESALLVLGINEGLLETALALRNQFASVRKSVSGKKPKVSLCMIVKDEEANLIKCLASVKPVVDEMIVVDTGSKDRTRDIAEFYGARVFEFEWNNDFAEARNFSISKADGDWILIMDADEVISSIDYDLFRKLTDKKPSGITGYSIVTRNYCNKANTIGWIPNNGHYASEEAGLGWLESKKIRLFSNHKNIKFEGAVHEMVDPVFRRHSVKTKKCSIPIHHYGRLDIEKLARKDQAYYEIGRKKLIKNGGDIGTIRELAVQATVLEKNSEAIELWHRFLSMKPGKLEVSDAYVNMVTAYIRMQDYYNALEFAQKAVSISPQMKEAQYNLGIAELYSGNVDGAYKIFKKLTLRNPDFPPGQFLLVASNYCRNDATDLKENIKKLKQNAIGAALPFSIAELAEGLMAANQLKLAFKLLKNAIGDEIISKNIMGLYTDCREKIKAAEIDTDIIEGKVGTFPKTMAECS